MINNRLKYYYDYVILILLLVFSAFPILPRAIESIVVILLTLFSLVYFVVEGRKNLHISKTKRFLSLSIFFWVYLFTLLYTKNINYGLNIIKIMLPIATFPFIFLVNKENLLQKKNTNKFIFIYITSILFYLIYLNLFVYKALFIKGLDIVQIRDSFEAATKVHGTYFSMWIGFAVVLLLFKMQEYKHQKLFLIPVSILLIFFLNWQNIIAARMPFFVTILFLVLFLLKNNIKLLIFILALIVGTLFILPKNNFYTERFERLKKYDFTFPKGEYSTNWPNISPEQIRNGIYYCSFLKIREAPIFGYGIGDADDQLQKCYDCEFTDTDTYKVLKYNSHNQYLNFILVSGILGILIIVFFQFKIIKIALKNKNILYIYFIFYIILNISFENVLHRQDGVMFFGFFNSILFFQFTHNKNEKSINS